MAKDGTNRGGSRVGAGRKPKSLHDKIQAGQDAQVIDLPTPTSLKGHVMPPVKEYLKTKQKNGLEFDAADIFKETWEWLVERGCEKLVNTQLIEQYAVSVSRWIQCEECISKFGFLARHPTTGNAIASPYVSMSRDYMKQSSQLWFQIFQVVKENNTTAYQGSTPQDDVMERLLRSRKGMN
ncbi:MULTISPECIES: P27 family phage terminase small subunit [Limosilactobacillus]|uniref:P27 family phage terminase small subunit n=1 Tax=Limosilactobacillus TaxID=2742598 RepID=UPI00146B8CCB|nr:MULTISPECIES: P27 family phage terminase small subunit [Limosilactobacillus]NMV53510.1 P27 family phage terminase small subunit [Limosilactobacillus reuteri]NMV57362.1 P27 family phage terminase small subunit [Limosilactobacillus reuteri]WPP07071.1 P27 family phage terminase small subunit [Limosilactobacillus fermentum]WRS43956.1 P27 family phage terminase small subunit [Limosilactobacillus fermentum]